MTLSPKVLVPRGTACGIREAVIGFSDDGDVVFYYPEDVHIDADGELELDNWYDLDEPFNPGEPEPILALKKRGSGFWTGKPYEWDGAQPTGSIAFTEEDALFLQETAKPGDLITRFKKR